MRQIIWNAACYADFPDNHDWKNLHLWMKIRMNHSSLILSRAAGNQLNIIRTSDSSKKAVVRLAQDQNTAEKV